MDFIELIKSVILGIVQGITEWLPISSTGHMILVDEFLNLKSISPHFSDVFMVVIQFGSILAVISLYFHKLNPFSPKKTSLQKKDTISLWLKVIVAVIPMAFCVLIESKVDEYLYNPIVVAAMLIIYGILFIVMESRQRSHQIGSFDELTYKTALFIGLFQLLAVIPGTSRSGATILGAVLLGTSRTVAAEFSFFLAIPTMLGASLFKLMKYGLAFTGGEWAVLLVGMVVAYIVSIFAIRFLMDYIKKHDFKAFGWYRIVLGIIVLLYFLVLK